MPMLDTALLVIDVQNDFLPGGSLAVRGGEKVIDPLNRAIERFRAAGLLVIATRDWHPLHTVHFVTDGGTWPVHCVQGTPGAAFAPTLQIEGAPIFSTGTEPDDDGYSGFTGRDHSGRTLDEALRAAGVRRLVAGGLATDYCVLQTVLDARQAGYEVTVIDEAIAAVDVNPGDGERARRRMIGAGATIVPLDEALALVRSPA